jgi:hypothetical protein
MTEGWGGRLNDESMMGRVGLLFSRRVGLGDCFFLGGGRSDWEIQMRPAAGSAMRSWRATLKETWGRMAESLIWSTHCAAVTGSDEAVYRGDLRLGLDRAGG